MSSARRACKYKVAQVRTPQINDEAGYCESLLSDAAVIDIGKRDHVRSGDDLTFVL